MSNNNGSVLTMLDSFVTSVELRKQASEPKTALYSANDAAAGLVPVVHGARYKENTEDVKDEGVTDKSTYPESKENSEDGTLGTKDADGAPMLKPKKQPDSKDVFNKAGHLKNLGNTILENLKKTAAPVAPAAVAPIKTAATAQAPATTTPAAPVKSNDEKLAEIVKSASGDADLYCDYLIAYSKRLQKSANEDAAAELASVAGDAGVAPATMGATMANGDGGLSPDDLALLNELEAQGITLEDIAQLLSQQGEGGAAAGGEPDADDMGGVEAMAEGMPQGEVDEAVGAADDITKAASILGIAPLDLFHSIHRKA